MSHSETSTKFIAKLEGGSVFQHEMTLGNSNEIASAIDSGTALMVIVIAQNFEQEIFDNRADYIQFITDGRNTMTASVANGYIGRIVDSFNGDGRIVSWFNPNLITRWNFLPGLMGLLSLVHLIGKAVVPVVIGIFQATLIFLIYRYVFAIPFAGSDVADCRPAFQK